MLKHRTFILTPLLLYSLALADIFQIAPYLIEP